MNSFDFDVARGDLVVDGDRILVRPLLLFAFYLLMAGHNRPGGGFVAGLVLAAALVLRAQGSGVKAAMGLLPASPRLMLSAGLLIAVAVSAAPLLGGGGVLDQPFTEVDLPLFHKVKFTAALGFDIGVVCIVAGMVGAIIEAFGDDGHGIPHDDGTPLTGRGLGGHGSSGNGLSGSVSS